jgi:hypothetical protein
MKVLTCRPGLIVIALLIFVSSSTPGWSQHTTAVKIHTFRSIDRLFTVSLEQAFTKHLSAELSVQGGYYVNVRPTRFEENKVYGIGGIGSLRYYPFTKKHSAPRGFFAFMNVRYIDFTELYRNSLYGQEFRVGGNMINAGAGAGYKFIYRRIGLDGFVGWGAGRQRSDDDEYRQNIPTFFQSAMEEQRHFPQLDIAICYMFSLN